MKNLIVIPFHDFKTTYDGFRTRDAHLYEYFMKNDHFDKVVIINRPTSLIEKIIGRKKVLSNGKIVYKNNNVFIQKYSEKVYIVDFLVYDTAGVVRKRHAWLPYIYGRKDIVAKTNEAIRWLSIDEAAIYMSSPFSVILGNKIEQTKVKILDAVDNYSKYKEWSYFKSEIEALYEEAKSSYDFIYVNSEDTYSYLEPNCSADLKLVPNGVDSFRFKGKFKRPTDLPEGKPIVGYAGKIQRMFNASLLAKMARTNPDLNFVLIGKFLDKSWKKEYWDKQLSRLANVFFLGEKDYFSLPAYYNHFDICMIPYYMENQHGGDPIKFYEYMAAQKPIISTDIGNIAKFNNNNSIFICDSEDEFISGLTFLKNSSLKEFDHKIPEYLEWQTIANNVIQDLMQFSNKSTEGL